MILLPSILNKPLFLFQNRSSSENFLKETKFPCNNWKQVSIEFSLEHYCSKRPIFSKLDILASTSSAIPSIIKTASNHTLTIFSYRLCLEELWINWINSYHHSPCINFNKYKYLKLNGLTIKLCWLPFWIFWSSPRRKICHCLPMQ